MDPAVKVKNLFGGHRVLKAEQRILMPKREKFADRRGADALSRRIRCYEFGVLIFETNQFAEDFVVFRIADFGLIEGVVTIVVIIDKPAEIFNFSANNFFIDRLLWPPPKE